MSDVARAGGDVFVITGPSGVGKGTLIGRLKARIPGLELSTSATTRPPREGERDGIDYFFLTEEEFQAKIEGGEFIEYARYSGNLYGTLRSEIEAKAAAATGVILEIELQGARQVRASMPEAVQVFIAPPEFEVLRRRLEGRGTDETEAIEARLKVAAEELEARDEFEHQVVNDDLDLATERLEAIVSRELSQ